MGIITNRKFRRGKPVRIQLLGRTGHGPVPRRRGHESEQKNPASNGRGMIDDFRLWGASGGVGPTRHPKSLGGAQRWRVTSTTPTLFSQRAEPSPLWSKVSPKRRIAPVAVASGAIEASVMGEGEGSGGGDEGARGGLPAVGGFEGAEPHASPNEIHWVGWLPDTTRCRAGDPCDRRPADAQEADSLNDRVGLRAVP